MIGIFLALDLVLFFVFFEFSLIPMYFLIGEWGSQTGSMPRSSSSSTPSPGRR